VRDKTRGLVARKALGEDVVGIPGGAVGILGDFVADGKDDLGAETGRVEIERLGHIVLWSVITRGFPGDLNFLGVKRGVDSFEAFADGRAGTRCLTNEY
jgi:hypothetical protein